MSAPSGVCPVVWLNGGFGAAADATVSLFDRGFLMADGIFETFYATKGAVIELDRHLARLASSAAYMRLRGLPASPVLAAAIRELLARNGLSGPTGGEASVRLTISRGVSPDGPPTVAIFARQLTTAQIEKRSSGVLGFVLPFTRGGAARDLTTHKTLAYLASSLGQILLAERTADPRAEGFFKDEDGSLLEGTASNLFIVEGGALVTPPLSQGILPGTSRAVVLLLAREAGREVREERVDEARLRA
ncbi:MAG: aminotransferase class IV, partial [Myxococcales bacterium]|nr:aminotransferase class IV [Myxococcales bacterium]